MTRTDAAPSAEFLVADFTVEEFRALFEDAPDGCLVVDEDGLIQGANAEIGRLFGYDRKELIGKDVELLVPDRWREAHEGERRRFQAAGKKRPMGMDLDLWGRRKDGSEFPVEVGLSSLETARGSYVVATVHDISQRKRYREFGAGLLQGAEEERQRIARDLHDDTAQRVAALLLRLQMARRANDPEEREEMLREMHGEIIRISDGVYRILRGLRPPALEEAGVVAAIRAHVRGVLSDSGLDVALEAEAIDDLLGSDAKLALYRIVQEALSNVVRHAEASRIAIRIWAEDGWVKASVEDDGIGFAVTSSPTEHGRGMGILGMQERANLVAGRVRIGTEPGAGTRVEIKFPYTVA